MFSGIENDYNSVYGNPKVVKQQLLEFLSPIAVHHGASFLAAVAVAWYERRNPFSSFKAVRIINKSFIEYDVIGYVF